MSTVTIRQMICAEILKLRRHRSTMLTAGVLSIGISALYFVVIISRGDGSIAADKALSSGSALLAMYFGSFSAILIGAAAGTLDLTSGVFRDLVATGRSRIALFAVRVPAAIMVALAFNFGGFAVTVAAALFCRKGGTGAEFGLIAEYAGWVALATTVVTALAVGVASLTGSRSVTLTTVIGWQTAATTLLFSAGFLGSLRQGLLTVALSHLRPGQAVGTREHPGSSNALPGLVLPMSTTVAVLVLLAWALIPIVIGARRIQAQEA